jgi:uncharacterized protein DUF1573/parallel beta helix pectate lyase-like protein
MGIMTSFRFGILLCFVFLLGTKPANGNTLQVGPGKPYAKPCAAIAAAASGNTIEIDSSGNYSGDVCGWSTNGLTIRGVGAGRPKIDAAGMNYAGKGIWVISGNDTTIENIEFTGATVPDQNGAGIRHQGGNLTIRNCYFHDNQEGILAGDNPGATILVEFSEFAHNGFGDGLTHNIYVNHFGKFVFQFNYSHNSIVGHLIKSRAAETDILYNRLTDEATGTGSYEIDLPNGGKSYIIGNLIEQGPQTQNSTVLSYLEEGLSSSNPDTELFVVNNTFVNDYPSGTFIYRAPADQVAAVVTNNIFKGPGHITNQTNAVQAGNFVGDALFVNAAVYDYHLTAASPAVNAGVNAGTGAGVSLVPSFQYVHPACGETRTTVGVIDTGAYELGGGGGVPLSGCGTLASSQASFSTTSLDFGTQAVSTKSASQTVKLINTGAAPLSISSIAISGDFAQTNNCESPLAEGATCAFNVNFTPVVVGNRTGLLTIVDNAPGSPHSVSLSGAGGAGADFSLDLSNSSSVATIRAGETATYALKVASSGGFSGTITFACKGAPAGAVCTVTPASLALNNGGTASVQINVSTVGISQASAALYRPGEAPGWPRPVEEHITVLFASLTLLAASFFFRFSALSSALQDKIRIVSLLGLLLLLNCGGGAGTPNSDPNGSTPDGTYTLILTAHSGNLSHSAPLTLTVQQ